MRDRSTDYTTGWISERCYYEVAPNLARGVAGLGGLGEIVSSLPSAAQRHVMRALDDPEVHDLIRELLRQPDPARALAEQAEKDVAEYLNPTGQPIVFKEIAKVAGKKIEAAQEAIIEALPDKDTEEAADAREIVRYAEDPKEALQVYYTQIALEAAAPEEGGFLIEQQDDEELAGYDDEDEILEKVGLGMSKKGKRIMKGIAIGAAVIGGAALAFVAGPAVIGAIGSVAGSVVSGVKGIFGGKPSAKKQEEAERVADAEYQRAYQAAIARGVDDQTALEEAERYRQLALQQAQQQQEQEQSSSGSTPGASAAPVDLSWVAEKAVELYKIKKGISTANVPPIVFEKQREEAIEVLVSQGVPRDQAERYIDEALARVAAQDASAGGAIRPSMEPVSRAGIVGAEGIPTWLLLGGAAIAILAGGGGGGRSRGGRRRSRR